MPTVISEISLYFKRILYGLEQKKDGDITDKYLLALLRKRLRTLDESLALVFTIKDRKGLALLARLKDYSTTRFKNYFRNRIMELEDTFLNQKISLVKATCAIAPELYLVAQRMKYEDKGEIGEGSTKKNITKKPRKDSRLFHIDTLSFFNFFFATHVRLKRFWY